MFISKKHLLISKTFCLNLILLLVSTISYGQFEQYFTGPNQVEPNSTHTYYYDDGGFYSRAVWLVSGGTKLTNGVLGTEYYVTIQWGSEGTGSLNLSSGMILVAGMNVNIGGSAPTPPPMPDIDNYPGYTVLTKVGPPPSGIGWYWQSSATGTDVSSGASASSVTLTQGTQYFLRAYKNLTNEWSSATVINYTIDPITPTFALSNENYVYTRVYKNPMASSSEIGSYDDIMESVVYYDGLGRPMQSIGIRAGGNTEDVITHVGYDDFGRQHKDYLPYASTNNIRLFRADAEPATSAYYLSSPYDTELDDLDPNPFSEKAFEASPLNRVLKQAAPGQGWQMGSGHEIDFGYHANTHDPLNPADATKDNVMLYEVSLSFANNTYTPTLVSGGYYSAGTLFKTVTKDENHDGGNTKNHTTEEFKDKQGRVILKRTYNDDVRHDTQYVYDDYGNLTYVIPPKVDASNGISSTELSELCYQYVYDNRNRLVEKKIPGKGWEYIVYNKLDQPVLTQDTNLKNQGKWLFTKYDAFGRVVYTGIKNSSNSRVSFQNSANNWSGDQFESKTTSYVTHNGTKVYYNNSAIPTTMDEILTINYYDNYTFDGFTSMPSSVDGQTVINHNNGVSTQKLTKGLPTGSKVRVLTTNQWITTYTGYDTKGRAIYNKSVNDYLGTMDIVESTLDFIGALQKSVTTHTKGATTVVTEDVFTYDHMGRLKKQTQELNNSNQLEFIVENSYDDLGQLESKGVGGKTSQSRLQTVDYSYNIRGWLKQINDPVNLGNDLFAFKINYNEPTEGYYSVDPLYNGNISQTIWKTANDNIKRGYAYEYDDLNRILKATSTKGSTLASGDAYNIWGIDYDPNGNLSRITRNTRMLGAITKMDELYYTYDSGNKLLKVHEASTTAAKNEGFKDGTNTGNDYTYDANGNMLRDYNKGITSNISYNYLNLPTSISIAGGNISYIYDALGTKLKKEVSTGTSVVYAGNYVYENGSLKFFNTPEGYVDAENGYQYVYQYKDHLGNVRLSYSDQDGNGSITVSTDPLVTEIIEENNYYPFGLKHKGYNNIVNGVDHLYGYNGKEEQNDFNNTLQWLDLGARMYDPAIGRFMTIDPMADFINYQSPYVVADNNPIAFIDFYGLGKKCGWLCRTFNRIIFGKDKLLPDGRLRSKWSRATGWALNNRNSSNNNSNSNSNTNTNNNDDNNNDDCNTCGTKTRIAMPKIDLGNNDVVTLPSAKLPEIQTPNPRRRKPKFGDIEIDSRLAVPTFLNFIDGGLGTNLDEDNAQTNKTLNAIVKTLTDYPQLKLLMYIKRQTHPKDKSNFNLERHQRITSERAAAIIKFLEGQGIDPSRVKWDYHPERFSLPGPETNVHIFEIRNDN